MTMERGEFPSDLTLGAFRHARLMDCEKAKKILFGRYFVSNIHLRLNVARIE